MKLLDILAASTKIDPGTIGLKDPIKDSDALLVNVLDAVYFWAGIIAVIVIIIAGYMYTTSDGEPSKTKRAKDAIMGSIIGLVVIIMAFTITQYVAGRI
jgi:type IV secretion system pilin